MWNHRDDQLWQTMRREILSLIGLIVFAGVCVMILRGMDLI